MGKSLQTRPKLIRLSVHHEGSISQDVAGKYTLAVESQWVVDRLFDELTTCRKNNRQLSQRALKLTKRVEELKIQRDNLMQEKSGVSKL
jgi:hypothetical protein